MVKARNRQGFQVQGIHLTEGQKGGLQGRLKKKKNNSGYWYVWS